MTTDTDDQRESSYPAAARAALTQEELTDAAKKYLRTTDEGLTEQDLLEMLDLTFEWHKVPGDISFRSWLGRELIAARAKLADRQRLAGALAAQDERELVAGQRVGIVFGCDTPEHMADEIEQLRADRQRLADECERLRALRTDLFEWVCAQLCDMCADPEHAEPPVIVGPAERNSNGRWYHSRTLKEDEHKLSPDICKATWLRQKFAALAARPDGAAKETK